ncbi:hypothetical protein [Streptomyces sp. YIM 132580]|uniref:hypothetical protein n=1 Tax=Streptomyces sp. DSS69 TaxID=3113369 RepID=UPI001F3B5699|nr:hypothetical protein [Streptomyces sp. YIM 132580]
MALTALDRGTARGDAGLGEFQRQTGRDPEPLAHQVHPGDHLGHGMFHLDTAVDLHRVEVAGVVHQEVEGARPCVLGGLGPEQRRLPQVDEIAQPVTEHLDLDVPGGGAVALRIDPVVPEQALRLAAWLTVLGRRLAGAAHHLRVPAAPTGHRFDDERVAGLHGEGAGLLKAGRRFDAAGEQGQPGLGHQRASADLVAQPVDDGRGRADGSAAVVLADLGEVGVLGGESVAGMQGLDPSA